MSAPPTVVLTEEHLAALPAHVRAWTDLLRSTDPADRAEFESALRDCHRYAGLAWPGRVVWVESPLVLAHAAPAADALLARDGPSAGSIVNKLVFPSGPDPVFDAVTAASGPWFDGTTPSANLKVVNHIRRTVTAAVTAAMDRPVEAAVESTTPDAAVAGAVRRAVCAATGSTAAPDAGTQPWLLPRDDWWRVWTSYLRDVHRLELPGDLWDQEGARGALLSGAGWWWLHPEFVMVCDRPCELHVEDTGSRLYGHRLHRADGPAISWRDGWALHFWHGTRVPADLVEGDPWTTERILAEPDPEIRRCATERRDGHPARSRPPRIP